VSGFRDAGAGEQNQAKPNQPGFAAAHHRTAQEGHSFLASVVLTQRLACRLGIAEGAYQTTISSQKARIGKMNVTGNNKLP
jgi:hypothetical protein